MNLCGRPSYIHPRRPGLGLGASRWSHEAAQEERDGVVPLPHCGRAWAESELKLIEHVLREQVGTCRGSMTLCETLD